MGHGNSLTGPPKRSETLRIARSRHYALGCPPAQDASHHQDCYVFSRESQPKPSFATVTGRGDNPNYAACAYREVTTAAPLWE